MGDLFCFDLFRDSRFRKHFGTKLELFKRAASLIVQYGYYGRNLARQAYYLKGLGNCWPPGEVELYIGIRNAVNFFHCLFSELS